MALMFGRRLALNSPAVLAGGGVLPPVYGLVTEGDSITAGTGPTPTYPTQMATETGLVVTNVAHAGDLLSLVDSEYASTIAGLYSSTTNNWLVILAGVNDLFNTVTAATLITLVQSVCAKARATGYKICLVTVLPTNHVSKPVGMDAELAAYNTWLRANWQTIAHRLADAAAVTELSDPNNTTYFLADKLHLTVAGFTALMTCIRTAMLIPLGLAPLSISNIAPVQNSLWSATITNRRAGSTITATASDGTVLTVVGSTVSGTFTTTGAKTVSLVETYAGYAFSPRTTPPIAVTVSAAVSINQDSVWGLVGTGMPKSNGDRDVNGFASAYRTALSSIGKTSGKWYWEIKVISLVTADPNFGLGICTSDINRDTLIGAAGTGKGGMFWVGNDANFLDEITAAASLSGVSLALNDILMVAGDFSNGKAYLGKNGAWLFGGDPDNDASPWVTFTPGGATWHMGITINSATGTNKMQLPATLAYAPPTAFSAPT